MGMDNGQYAIPCRPNCVLTNNLYHLEQARVSINYGTTGMVESIQAGFVPVPPAKKAIADILHHKSPWKILGLTIEGLEKDEDLLRRNYKKLALQVHPDKNSHEGAEEAFKKVSEAYEYLLATPLDELQSQREKDSSYNNKPNKKRSSKRPREKSTKVPFSSFRPKRKKTPSEIWKEFAEEEEQFLREEMRKEERRRERSQCKAEHTKKKEQDMKDAFAQETMNSDIHGKAEHWRSFATREAHSNTRASTQRYKPPRNDCLLCRRQFNTLEGLRRHEALSKLHETNLKLQQLDEAIEEFE